MYLKHCYGICALVVLCFVSPVKAMEAGAEGAVGQAFAASKLPGFCAVSFDARREISHHAGGYADAARRQAYDQDTVQPVASISKTVLGLAIAQLAVAGKIDLDAPIDTYLPWRVRNPRFPHTPITLRQLATHTSGLMDTAIYDRAYQDGHRAHLSMRTFVRRYTDPKGRWFAIGNFGTYRPGAHYKYSNLGADLAAVVIEYRTGMSFRRYAREHVFAPLGMKHTAFVYRSSERNAILFDGKNQPMTPYTLVTYADGGMRTTCRDMATYMQAVLRAYAGKASPLRASVVRMALGPQFKADAFPSGLNNPNHGLFWSWKKGLGVGHTGGDPGVTAHAYLDLKKQRGFVMIFNAGADDSASHAEGVRAIWHAWHPLGD